MKADIKNHQIKDELIREGEGRHLSQQKKGKRKKFNGWCFLPEFAFCEDEKGRRTIKEDFYKKLQERGLI